MIKTVIFDVDGVLADSFEANLRFFSKLLPKFGYSAPTREEYAVLFHKPMIEVIKIRTGSKSNEEIDKIYKAGMSRAVKYDLSLVTIPDGAKETLEILSRDYTLAIVTSRIRKSVYEAPPLAALRKYFKVAVALEDTVNHKPHPEPLLLAAQKLNTVPSECVYIGDTESDMIAARAAGMKFVMYSTNTCPDADGSTAVFKELPILIKSL